MEKITFTNSLGEAITFDGPPFYLQSIDGLGDVTANVQLQKAPHQHGGRAIEITLNEREMPVSFVIGAEGHEDLETDLSRKRTAVANVLNPVLGAGVLEYQSGDIVRLIKCIPDSVPVYPDNKRSQRLQVGSVTFIAPRPHWQSRTKSNAAVGTPMFEFPFSDEFQFGVQRDEFFVQNTGDADTPVEITIYGAIKNPVITNVTTGKFIKLDIELQENEMLYINTDIDDLRIEYTDADGVAHDALHRMSFDSTFSGFVLINTGRRGRNDITFTADTPIEFTNIELAYSLRYNAV